MFTTNASLILSTILGFCDTLFSITIPGTTITFKGLFLSVLVTSFVIILIRAFLGSASIGSAGMETITNHSAPETKRLSDYDNTPRLPAPSKKSYKR